MNSKHTWFSPSLVSCAHCRTARIPLASRRTDSQRYSRGVCTSWTSRWAYPPACALHRSGLFRWGSRTPATKTCIQDVHTPLSARSPSPATCASCRIVQNHRENRTNHVYFENIIYTIYIHYYSDNNTTRCILLLSQLLRIQYYCITHHWCSGGTVLCHALLGLHVDHVLSLVISAEPPAAAQQVEGWVDRGTAFVLASLVFHVHHVRQLVHHTVLSPSSGKVE